MPLVDLTSDLKSLKYGNDRPNGSSAQPYIQVDVNTGLTGIKLIDNTFGGEIRPDEGFIRGGATNALKASLVDTVRIGKFFTDLPKGPLFIAKQVGLQLSNPRLDTKKEGNLKPSDGLFQPTRIYNLGINTLSQTAVNAFGIHFDRHGVLPVQNEDTKYENVAEYNNIPEWNRLVRLRDKLFSSSTNDGDRNIIDKYIGGPNSVYGVGTTTIKRYGGAITNFATTFKEDWSEAVKFTFYNKAGQALIDPNGSQRKFEYSINEIIEVNNLVQTSNSNLKAGKYILNKSEKYVSINEAKSTVSTAYESGFPINASPKTGSSSIGAYGDTITIPNPESTTTTIKPFEVPGSVLATSYKALRDKIDKTNEEYSIINTYSDQYSNTVSSPGAGAVNMNGVPTNASSSYTYTPASFTTKKVQKTFKKQYFKDNNRENYNEVNLTPIFDGINYYDSNVINEQPGDEAVTTVSNL